MSLGRKNGLMWKTTTTEREKKKEENRVGDMHQMPSLGLLLFADKAGAHLRAGVSSL